MGMQCLLSKYVLIMACGSGLRMQTATPKQYIILNDKPLLFHTIENIHSIDSCYKIIVVINKEHSIIFKKLQKQYALNIPLIITYGGNQRFYSVKNGLSMINDEKSLVAIHDGVRPFVSKQMFNDGFDMANKQGNAICAVKSLDSVRIMTKENNNAIDRDTIYLIQTPQFFKTSLIKDAYKQSYRKEFTDDATVLEYYGHKINIIDGLRENIKVTYPFDLTIASHLLNLQISTDNKT